MNFTELKSRLIGPHVTVITPWKGPQQELDEPALRGNVRWLIGQGIVEGAGVLITGGTNGQGFAMSPEERRRVAEIILDEARGKVPVLVGNSDTSPRLAIELARFAQDHGAVGVMSTAPFYFPPTQGDILAYYRMLADAIGIGILAYDISEVTKKSIDTDSFEELCKIENVVAIKVGAPMENYTRNIARWGARLSFLTNALFCVGMGYFVGARGHVTGFGNFVPKLETALYSAAMDKNWGEVRAIEEKRFALCECAFAFMDRHGPYAGVEMLNEATEMVGQSGGTGRPPLKPLTQRDRQELRVAIAKCGGTVSD